MPRQKLRGGGGRAAAVGAPTLHDGRRIERFREAHYDRTVGEIQFNVEVENEEGTRWLWRHEISRELPDEVTQMINDALMRNYQKQEADPRRRDRSEVYPVEAISRCLLLKEPFFESNQRVYFYEVKWEGEWKCKGLEPEDTLRHCGAEVKRMMKQQKRKLQRKLEKLHPVDKIDSEDEDDIFVSRSQILPQQGIIGCPERRREIIRGEATEENSGDEDDERSESTAASQAHEQQQDTHSSIDFFLDWREPMHHRFCGPSLV